MTDYDLKYFFQPFQAWIKKKVWWWETDSYAVMTIQKLKTSFGNFELWLFFTISPKKNIQFKEGKKEACTC